MVYRCLAIAFGSVLLLLFAMRLGVAQDSDVSPPGVRGFDRLDASFYDVSDLNEFAFSIPWIDPIDFLLACWDESAPYEGCELHPGLADGANYSVRWEGELVVPVSGDYTFSALYPDDGVRLMLDDEEILDQGWRYPIPDLRPSPQTVFLSAGPHRVVIDYEQRVPFVASLQLRWSGPGFAEEVIPNLAAPPEVTRLIHYRFDEDQIYEQTVENRVVGSFDWMKGRVSGDPEPVAGASGAPDDLALRFNVPASAAVDFVEVIRGEYLTFSQGIHFASKIYLEEVPSKSAMILASQVNESKEMATTPWRVSLDRWVVPGKLTLTLLLTFEGGRVSTVYHELSEPTDYLGRWVDVAASYNPATGAAALLWDGRWVETEVVGPGTLASGRAPIRIGKAFSVGTWAFQGGIDEVEIWGDSPACHRLTTLTELENEEGDIEPGAGGIVVRNPPESQLPAFCEGDGRYAVGEKVNLEAETSGRNAFYQWKGAIEYLEGSERHKYDISLTLLDDTAATAHFLAWGDERLPAYPLMSVFPVDRQHNTGYDRKTCDPNPCDYGCGLEAKALANSDCHFGGLDIFAPMDPKDPADPWPDENQAYVVNARRGQVVFYCDYDAKKQELVGGNSALVYVPNRLDPDFIYYYAHMDQVCSSKGRNLCTEELLERECPGCEPHEPQTEDLRCRRIYRDLQFVRPGRRLGAVGRSGNAIDTAPHLHFALFDVIGPERWRASCEALNPLAFLYPLEETTTCRSSR